MPIQLENIKLYSLKEIAHFSKVGIITLRRYVKEGRLKGQKIGLGWYVTEESLQKFLFPSLRDLGVRPFGNGEDGEYGDEEREGVT